MSGMSGIKPDGEGDAPVEDRNDASADGDKQTDDSGDGGTRQNASEKETASGRGEPADGMWEGAKVAVNIFNDKVGALGATFGFGRAAQAEAASTGPMPEATITAAVENYVYPGSYDGALGSLRSDGVVVLAGAVGHGKRTGAFALLRDVLRPGAPIVSLPPTAELRKLADRDYETGYGYVIFDWFGTPGGREADHTWQRVSAKVRAANAYLIVTSSDLPRRTPESVDYVGWECPDLAATLRAHLGEATPDETIAKIVKDLPSEIAMDAIVRIARMVADGTEPQSAVDEVLDQSKRREVSDWFDEEPNRRLILDITTLAFLVGVDERAFDTGRARLEAALEDTIPVAPPKAAEPNDGDGSPPVTETAMTQDRQRLRGNPLIKLDREVVDGVSRRALVFREDGHHRYVLEELADRFGVDFWDAVRTWLDEIVRDESHQISVANSLALLAYAAFDEIDASYLDPWAAGQHGWPHRYTAVFALWFMCFDEALVPIALRTAVRWATQGDTERRRTAILAFSGELGVHYPSESATRLWQLIAHHDGLSEEATTGFGSLFATLVARKTKAGLLIAHIDSLLRKTPPRERTRIRHRRTLRAALALVEARNLVTGRPAISEYVAENPDRIAVVGRIWAALLKHRPLRHAALQALLKALRALESLSADAERDATALGDALGDALPEAEHAALTADFTRLASRSGKAQRSSDALARIMLAALDRTHRNLGGTS